MTYHGTVKNGTVQLEPGAELPDGTKVEVRPLPAGAPEADQRKPLLKYLDMASDMGLPANFAEQHAHYIHGTPKR